MHTRTWLVLAIGAALSWCAGSASAQDREVDAKIDALEKRIKELEAAQPPKEKPAESLAPPVNKTVPPETQLSAPAWSLFNLTPAVNNFKDGFIVRSADDQHQLRITGQLQTDMRVYPRHSDFTDNDTFLIRRARLGIEATVFKYYEFRFLPDWGNNRNVIQDGYFNVHYWDELQFQGGKFRAPVSYEQLIQDRFVPTMERSLVDQIVAARDIGFMLHGQKLFANQVDYAIGVFNGEENADIDTNKIKDFDGRVVWRPFNYDTLPEFVRPLQIGISGSIGKEQEPLNFNGSNTPGTLRTPANIPWLVFNAPVRADGIRSRVTPEVSYIYNSFGFAAQYMRMDQDMRSGIPTANVNKAGQITSITNDPVQDIRFGAYYFMMTYLLTGEKRTTYSQPIQPLRPFDPLHPIASPGAWELVARVSHMQVDPSISRSGLLYNLAKANGNSDAATELTVGFNWYLNSLVRMQLNWEHAWFQQPLLLGPPTTYFRQTDALLVRFQIIF